MVTCLLGVHLIATDLSLVGFTYGRVEWLLNVIELQGNRQYYSIEGFYSFHWVIWHIV